MRARASIPLLALSALLAFAAPTSAQFNAYYEGTQLVDGKPHAASTQFSIDKDRVAAIFKGATSNRMIYLKEGGLLRVVDDDKKQYFDLAHDGRNAMADASAQMQQMLAQMPPEQRAMMAKMGGGGMPSMTPPAPNNYVRTDTTQKVLGYDCTRVNVMRGEERRAEYWGSTSKDFLLSDAERATRIAMQEAIGGMPTFQNGPGGETRPFEWDTKSDGYPLISRCFDGDQMTLDLRLARFDRKPLDPALFEVPKGYTKQEMDMGKGMGGRDRKGYTIGKRR